MRMSRRSLLAYDRLVGDSGDRAAAAYGRMLSLWLSENPHATENEVVDAAADFACAALGTFGASAAAAADELCRQLAAQDGLSGTTHTDYAPDRGEVGRVLGGRRSRAPLSRGDRPGFVAASSDRVRDECHRAANGQMLRSAKALGCRRYARVPVGDSKTCGFCVSVAANGFHGLTEEGAKRLLELHDNCRCKVVPGFGRAPSVEGYDPGEYEEANELRKRLEQEGYSVSQIQRAMAGTPVDELGPPNSGAGGRPRKPPVDPERRAEVARQLGLEDNEENRWAMELDLSLRDEGWLAGGPAPGITYAPGAEESKRRKGNPKLFTKEHEVERETVRLSAALGYASEFQEDEIPNPDPEDAKRRPRIGLPDLSSGMEVKTLRDASSYNTVARHASSSKSKGAISTLMSFYGNGSLTASKIDEYVENSMKAKRLRHVVAIYPDGTHSIKVKK